MKAPAENIRQPVVRLAELEIDPAAIDTYLSYLKEEIDASIALEPGVLALHAVSIKNRSDQIRILEVYADQPAYEAHLQSPHFLRYKEMTSGMVRSLRLIETDPIRLRSKTGI